jgi:hypothetical protein
VRRIIITVLIVLAASAVFGWSSVGFKIKDHDLVKQYKLPDWGYSQIELELSGYSRLNREDHFPGGYGTDRNEDISARIRFRPNYYRVFQSEKLNYSLQANLSSAIYYNEDVYPNERIQRDYDNGAHISSYFNKYFKNDYFYYTSIGSRYYYNEKNYSENYSNNDRLDRGIESNLSVGIGKGRVRDVSPVFKALRLRERIEALNKGHTLNEEQVKNIAAKFALYPKFSSLYDRYEKYFWAEIGPELGEEIENLPVAETIYLTEVMKEYIRRRQGNEVVIGIETRQNYEKDRFNYNANYETITEEYFAGPFFRYERVNNFNLNYQIEFSTNLSYLFKFTSNTELEQRFDLEDDFRNDSSLNLSFSNRHYYQITDRFSWQGNIYLSYNYIWLEDISYNDYNSGDLIYMNDLKGYDISADFSSSLEYFLEDNFSFSLRVDSNLRHISEDVSNICYHHALNHQLMRDEHFSISFGCRYYFSNPF